MVMLSNKTMAVYQTIRVVTENNFDTGDIRVRLYFGEAVVAEFEVDSVTLDTVATPDGPMLSQRAWDRIRDSAIDSAIVRGARRELEE